MDQKPARSAFDFADSEDSAFEAELERGEMSEQEREIRRQVRRLADFYRHVMLYVLIIGSLWVACLLTMQPNKSNWAAYWAIWPTLGWGAGLLFHGSSVLPSVQIWGRKWEERKVRELMERQGFR